MMSTLKLMQNLDMFGFPVCVFNNPVHEKYKDALLQEKEINKVSCPVGSDTPHTYMTGIHDEVQFIKRESESMSSLREVFNACLDYYYNDVLKTKFIKGTSWEYLRSWCFSSTEHYHSEREQHFHGHWMSCVTILYYLDYPPGSGGLSFKSDNNKNSAFYYVEHEGLNNIKTVQAQEGTVMLFPSCLLHAVEKSSSEAYSKRSTIVADTCPSVIDPCPHDLAMNAIRIERVPLSLV